MLQSIRSIILQFFFWVFFFKTEHQIFWFSVPHCMFDQRTFTLFESYTLLIFPVYNLGIQSKWMNGKVKKTEWVCCRMTRHRTKLVLFNLLSARYIWNIVLCVTASCKIPFGMSEKFELQVDWHHGTDIPTVPYSPELMWSPLQHWKRLKTILCPQNMTSLFL